MGQLHEIAEPHLGPSDDVRYALRQAGAIDEHARILVQPIGLAERGLQIPSRRAQLPVHAICHAGAILDPVVSGKAVEREEVGILQIDRARILVGDREVADRRAGGELDARGQHLIPAEKLAHQRPFHIHRRDCDTACFPSRIAAIERRVGERIVARMVYIAAHQAGQRHQLAHPGHAAQIPASAGEGALRVLPLVAQDGEAVGL